MEPVVSATCPKCSFKTNGSDPFCLTCGEPSPQMVVRGSFAVEMGEVASSALREEAARVLRTWFPALDPLTTDRRLAKGWYTLAAGIDEESSRRIMEALKVLKVDARLTRADDHKSPLRLLWNGGLIWTAGALVLAALLPGVFSLLFVVIGAGIPVAIALRHSDRLVPMVPVMPVREHSEAWVDLARQYGGFITGLGEEDRRSLATLMGTIFSLIRDLERGSLAAVAAGKERGDLYYQLFEAAATAVEIGRRISSASPETAADLRKELEELAGVFQKTGEWFRGQDREQLKPSKDFAAELEYVKESIDRILEDVRTPRPTTTVPQTTPEKEPQ
ncbi:MAG: hypothetical protein AB1646_19475 [Thermodesulfobacteriota bacterium]